MTRAGIFVAPKLKYVWSVDRKTLARLKAMSLPYPKRLSLKPLTTIT
jgi:hypothetical protein